MPGIFSPSAILTLCMCVCVCGGGGSCGVCIEILDPSRIAVARELLNPVCGWMFLSIWERLALFEITDQCQWQQEVMLLEHFETTSNRAAWFKSAVITSWRHTLWTELLVPTLLMCSCRSCIYALISLCTTMSRNLLKPQLMIFRCCRWYEIGWFHGQRQAIWACLLQC